MKIPHGLAYKQAQISVSIAFLLGVFTSLFQILVDYQETVQKQDGTVQQIMQIVEESIVDAVFNKDIELLEKQLNGLFRYQLIREIQVIDKNQNELSRITKEQIENPYRWINDLIFGESKQYEIKLLSWDQKSFGELALHHKTDANRFTHYGLLIVQVDTFHNGMIFLKRVGAILSFGLLRNFLLSLILLWFFNGYIILPILSLQRELNLFSPSNPSKHRLSPPKVHKKTELGDIVKKMNVLIETFENTIVDRIGSAKEAERLKVEAIEREKREEEQKTHKFNLKEHRMKLQQKVDELSETQAQLVQSEKMAALGGLVSGVAHEINTPIGIAVTAITHFMAENREITEQFKDGEITGEGFHEHLEQVLQISDMIFFNVQRTAKLVKGFKQIAVDQSQENRCQFQVRETIHGIWANFGEDLQETHHHVTISEGPPIEMDSYPIVFSQVIINLLQNSMRHAFAPGKGGNIHFELETENEELLLTYSDDGRGIREEDLQKIFNPFFTTNRKEGGTGLGLHLVFNIVQEVLDGKISCESEVGKGTTFFLRVPLLAQSTPVGTVENLT